MKRPKKTTIVLGTFISGILILGLLLTEVAASEIVLRFAGNLPVNHHLTRNQEFFAKLVTEKTQGKVKVEVYPAGKLFSDKDLLRALPSGAVEMGHVTCDQWTGIEPLWVFFDLPFHYKDRSHWHRILDSEVGEMLRQEFEKKSGLKVLYLADYGSAAFASKVPLRTLEDFKGRRIRAVGESNAEMIKALGASPAFMGGGEVYMALQRGTVEAAASGVNSFWERKYYEVTKYLSCPGYTFATHAELINKKKWDTLPGDVQKAMLEAAEEAKEWTRKECEKVDNEAISLLKQKGMDVYDPPEKEKTRWKEACKPLFDLALRRAGEKGKMVLDTADKLR